MSKRYAILKEMAHAGMSDRRHRSAHAPARPGACVRNGRLISGDSCFCLFAALVAFVRLRKQSPRVTPTMPEKASHPKYMDMVKEAIRKNYSAKGTSRQRIKSFIEQTYHIQALNSMLRATLEKASVEGMIEKTSDGSRYRLTSKGRLSMEKKKKEKKASKPTSAPKKVVKKAAASKAKTPRKTAVKVKKVAKPVMKKKTPAMAKKPVKATAKSRAKPVKKAAANPVKKSVAKPVKKTSMKKATKAKK